MPASLIEQQHCVASGSYIGAIAARYGFIVAVLHQGRIRPMALPSVARLEQWNPDSGFGSNVIIKLS
jgi:hypothetical protein